MPPAIHVSLWGPVLAMGELDAAPANGCSFGITGTVPSSFWFEAADANGEIWNVGITLPDMAKPIAPGDIIAADIVYEFGGWGGTVNSFSLRDGNGKLLVYTGAGRGLYDLDLPADISAAQGERHCIHSDNCGDLSFYGLDVTAGGMTKAVGYGASETIGHYRVIHEGFEMPYATGGCHMWHLGHVGIAIAPLP